MNSFCARCIHTHFHFIFAATNLTRTAYNGRHVPGTHSLHPSSMIGIECDSLRVCKSSRDNRLHRLSGIGRTLDLSDSIDPRVTDFAPARLTQELRSTIDNIYSVTEYILSMVPRTLGQGSVLIPRWVWRKVPEPGDYSAQVGPLPDFDGWGQATPDYTLQCKYNSALQLCI